jgi:hypothetical protein
MNRETIHALKTKLEKQIQTANPKLLKDFPLERYCSLIAGYPRLANYAYVSPEVKKFCDAVLMNSNGHVLELYNKCLLLELMEKAVDRLDHLRLTHEIKGLYLINFERIVREIENNENTSGFYMYPDDKFLKELGVCSLKMIPAGAQKISLSPLPVGFLFKEVKSQFIEALKFVVFDLKGVNLFYSIHTDSHDPHLMSEFNAQGWRVFLMRCSDILKLNPEVKGIFGISWFIDPQLEKISPKVCYVRHILYQSGGKIFFVAPAVSSIQDAVYKSPTRKQLYDRGKYIPRDYIGIWPRKALISWADKEKGLIQ